MIVATAWNQSTLIRLRGRLDEDRKRRTKNSGKIPCTVSPDPVRSPIARPSAPKPTAASVPIAMITSTPAKPVAK